MVTINKIKQPQVSAQVSFIVFGFYPYELHNCLDLIHLKTFALLVLIISINILLATDSRHWSYKGIWGPCLLK